MEFLELLEKRIRKHVVEELEYIKLGREYDTTRYDAMARDSRAKIEEVLEMGRLAGVHEEIYEYFEGVRAERKALYA